MKNKLQWLFSTNSLRFKLLSIILVMVIPLILLLIYFSQYSIQVVHDQVAKSNKNLLNLYMEQTDSILAEVDNYLSNQIATNYDYIYLSSYNDDEYNIAKISISNTMSTDIKLHSMIDSFFVYESSKQDFFYVFNQRGDFRERDTIQRYLQQEVLKDNSVMKDEALNSWNVLQINNNFYMYRLYQFDDIYVGAWANFKYMMNPMDLINLGENGKLFFTSSEGVPLVSDSDHVVANINMDKSEDDYYITGSEEKYLVIREASKRGEFSLVAYVQDESILDNLPFLKQLVLFISCTALIVPPITLYLLRRTVLLPLNRILAAIKHTRDGVIDYRIEQYKTSDEFIKVNEAFNQMTSQIHTLRINVYEEQLSNQRTELKLLQLQLNPHFLMNSLNIMHSLAFMKRFEVIQDLCINLVQYFRYILKSNVTYVPLKDELNHVSNYLRIQEHRFQEQLTYSIQSPEAYNNFEVPPLIVQTFVENTVKHAVTMDEPIHISINIELVLDPEAIIKISVSDTGAGFPEDVLDILNKGEQLYDEHGGHIGIWNIQRRLKLLYNGAARIQFSNCDPGAVIEIWLPLKG